MAAPLPALKPSDEHLLRGAIAGDAAAYSQLCSRYQDAIFNYCYRLCNSHDDALDAVQETFLKVFQRIHESKCVKLTNVRAYFYTVARNTTYDMVRVRSRANPVDVVPEPRRDSFGGSDPQISVDADPLRNAMLDASRTDLREANARIPERHREVLALRELEGMSLSEIGGVLDMTPNSVGQLLFRARASLRKELRHETLAAFSPTSEDCQRTLSLLTQFTDGQLDKADHDWVEQHLVDCTSCTGANEALQEVAATYRGWAPIVVGASLFDIDQAHAAVEHADANAGIIQRLSRNRKAKRLSALVASGFILLAVASLLATQLGATVVAPSASAPTLPEHLFGDPSPSDSLAKKRAKQSAAHPAKSKRHRASAESRLGSGTSNSSNKSGTSDAGSATSGPSGGGSSPSGSSGGNPPSRSGLSGSGSGGTGGGSTGGGSAGGGSGGGSSGSGPSNSGAPSSGGGDSSTGGSSGTPALPDGGGL